MVIKNTKHINLILCIFTILILAQLLQFYNKSQAYPDLLVGKKNKLGSTYPCKGEIMSPRVVNLFFFIAVLLAFSILFLVSDASGAPIRTCEGCHGFESLHNIQADSDGDGVINPGVEMPGYGHIGHDDDCWGCHGFLQSNAPGTGPVVPTIISSDVSVITAGFDTSVTLTGAGFTNIIYGFELTSNIRLSASDGSPIDLTPDSISEDSLTVTIPGTTAIGNYDVRAVKGNTESNPIVISVIPDVFITDVECNKKRGLLAINGTGFSKKVEGTDAYINLKVNGAMAEIIAWTDTQIHASVPSCSIRTTVTVNALYGTATSSNNGNGKPPKPCKGKGCNK